MEKNNGLADVQAESSTALAACLYTRLPDGSSLNRNRVYDAIDKVTATEKQKDDPFRDKKRYLYQYKNALRDRDAVLERYERIISPVTYTDQNVMRDPTRRLSIAEAYRAETSAVQRILAQAEQNCSEAKVRVARVICGLEDETQRLILVAHYVCGADLKWISVVYGHNPYWAKEIRDNSLEIVDCDAGEIALKSDTQRTRDLDRLIDKWTEEESKYNETLAQEAPRQMLDDRMMLMGLI